MIQISKPMIGKEEIDLVNEVLKSGYIVQGPKVEQLEKEFNKLCGTIYAVAVSNGTAALHTALYAIGIKPGDEIITTAFTFIATANSILMAGAIPVFADIDPDTYNIDPKSVEKLITKKTKAILPVNLYGQPADYTELRRIAKKHNLLIVEDAAQSVGAKYKNKVSGNLADISCFSLYATKNLMCGEGGMITTNSKKFMERAKLYRHHGQSEQKRYYYFDLGYNYRMTDLHAAIALAQIRKLSKMTKARQLNAKFFDNSLNAVKGIITPEVAKDNKHVYHQYTIRIEKDFGKTREQMQEILLDEGIQTNIYYPIPLYMFTHLKNGKRVALPHTKKASEEVLSIPVHPNLSKDDLKTIVHAIKSAI